MYVNRECGKRRNGQDVWAQSAWKGRVRAMERITVKREDGYAIPAEKTSHAGAMLYGEAAERLAAYENTFEALLAQLEDTEDKLEELRRLGKASSVTFRQLLGKKINGENLLSLFSIYGIEQQREESK